MATAKARRRDEQTPASGVRDRILDAALAILRESGVQRLTQVHVSERAGVRQSHLTYYFPTRRDLLHAVVARGAEGTARAVHSAVAAPDGAVHDLVSRTATAVASLEHMRLFVAMIVESDGDPALRTLMIEGTRRFEASLIESLSDSLGDARAREIARHVLIALWGLGLYEFAVRPAGRANPLRSYVEWITGAIVAPVPSPPARARR